MNTPTRHYLKVVHVCSPSIETPEGGVRAPLILENIALIFSKSLEYIFINALTVVAKSPKVCACSLAPLK